MNIFTLILSVSALINVMAMGLVEVIKSFEDYKFYGLNYLKTENMHKKLKRTAYVNLILFIVSLVINSIAIYHLFTVLL